jgi:hypothetical protein
MVMLMQCFHRIRPHGHLKVVRVRPWDQHALDTTDNIVILTTPTSHGTWEIDSLVSEIERDWPMSHLSGRNTTSVRGRSGRLKPSYQDEIRDTSHKVANAELVKWIVLTRRQERGRFITLLAGWHGRSIEGLAEILAQPQEKQSERGASGHMADLKELAEMLQSGGRFPHQFQALYAVHLSLSKGEPRITEVRLVDAVSMDEKRLAARR